LPIAIIPPITKFEAAMGFKYNIRSEEMYFLTFTVTDWVDVFTRKDYRYIITDSLKYCQQNKGLNLFAWCIMSNHMHLIASSKEKFNLSDCMRDFKKFTSKKVVQAIQENNESRKEWMLDRFRFKGKYNPKIKEYQFWQEGLHAVELTSNKFMEQKLDYIHNNPVEADIVAKPEDYLYSSAIDYAGGKGLLDVCFIE
jgi:putative transposase